MLSIFHLIRRVLTHLVILLLARMNLLLTNNTMNLMDQMAFVNASFKHSPSQANLSGFVYTTRV